MSDPANLIHFEGTLDELFQKIYDHPGLTVLKYGSTRCPPCKRLNQMLPAIATDNETVLFLCVELDLHRELGGDYGINSVPTVMFFRGKGEDGKPHELARIVGLKVPEIKAKIAELK